MIVLYGFLDHGGYAVRQALIPAICPTEQVVQVRALQHTVANIGVALGAMLGGIALSRDTKAAYLSVFFVGAAMFLACGAILFRLPSVTHPKIQELRIQAFTVLRDQPYMVLTAINMIVLFEGPLLEVIFPLWISERTRAPRWLFGVLVLLNTLVVILFQMKVSNGIANLLSARRAFRLAGALLFVTCLIMTLTTGSSWMAIVLLIVAALLQVAAELYFFAGSWVISYRLAPEDKQGQYLGLFNTGYAAASTAGPALLTLMLIEWKTPGWLTLGSVFLVAGLLVDPAVRWASRSSIPRAALRSKRPHAAEPDTIPTASALAMPADESAVPPLSGGHVG
jgi:predicted MFS family arabinose efflux permease